MQGFVTSLFLAAIGISGATAACCQGTGTSDVPSTCPAVGGTDLKWMTSYSGDCVSVLSCIKYNCVTTVAGKASTQYYQDCSTSVLVDAVITGLKGTSSSISCTKSGATGNVMLARQGSVLSFILVGLSGLLLAARH